MTPVTPETPEMSETPARTVNERARLVARYEMALVRLHASEMDDKQRRYLLDRLNEEEHAGALLRHFPENQSLLFLSMLDEVTMKSWNRKWPRLRSLLEEAVQQ